MSHIFRFEDEPARRFCFAAMNPSGLTNARDEIVKKLLLHLNSSLTSAATSFSPSARVPGWFVGNDDVGFMARAWATGFIWRRELGGFSTAATMPE
ncbi:MAG TPA: hypothetical protein VF381_14505 [Thermoanaerobaculia bacterium]